MEDLGAGRIMNSWMSTLLSACAPPLMTFIIGTGSVRLPTPPRWRNSDTPFSAAAALAVASEIARIALAPSLALLWVPSSAIIVASTRA
jgi:hypothetical protein